MRKLAGILFALGSLCLMATPAAAINWGIGADLGFNILMPDDEYEGAENMTSIGFPFGASRVGEFSFLPPGGGLRFSFAGENPMHEVWVGTSFGSLGEDDYSLSFLQLSGNYQFNFATQGAFKPYLTAGMGLNRAAYSGDDEDESATAAFFGGGVGAAYKMGTGRLRGELRYDVLNEATIGDDDYDYVVIPKGGSLGFKLGFDLWAK